jgi:DNA-binding transcriptional regulator YhcF (GntR family)
MPTVLAMPYSVDMRSEVPAYLQLAGQLRDDIGAGRIEAGGQLPSLTRLVQETGLDVKTVQRAVSVLRDEGLAYVVPGRGTFARQQSS